MAVKRIKAKADALALLKLLAAALVASGAVKEADLPRELRAKQA